jgi:sec-independent protein translocase protein TatA
MIGSTEIIIIAAVVLVLFGATAIPRFARSLGKARREFKEGLAEGEKEAEESPAKERAAAAKQPREGKGA